MNDARDLTMRTKELDRLEIMGRVIERRLTQRKAAEQLGLSLRQVERLCRAYRWDGAAGLVSRKHGFDLSRETLRRWMIEAGFWIPRSHRQRRAHQPRHRRSCLGQTDPDRRLRSRLERLRHRRPARDS